MKKRHIFGLLMAAPVVAFLAGPRPDPDFTIRTPELPDDLDDYLGTGEAALVDITPGTEKTIRWQDTLETKTSLSIVYLHGFSGTRRETAPLSEFVADDLGANLFYPRLAGHGRPGEALRGVSLNQWINDTVEAIEIGRRLGDKVVVIATSTGATLATWLMAQPEYRDAVACAILMSPNFAPADRGARVALWPWGRQIIRAAIGDYRSWEAKNELQERYWTTRYPIEALVPMMSLVDAVDATDLSVVKTPLLVLYSERDEVVSVPRIKERFAAFGSQKKELVAVADSEGDDNHVLAGAIVAPSRTRHLADKIVSFVRSTVPVTGNPES